MPDCYLALGGNEGDVPATFTRALAELQRVDGVAVREVSPLYSTAAVGPDATPEYLNAAARLSIELPAEELLDLLLLIEERMGRRRTNRWESRPVDLDLLLYGSEVLHSPTLTVPHPHCWYRRFALDPLLDLTEVPDHPVLGESFAVLRSRLQQRPLPLSVVGSGNRDRQACQEYLSDAFPGRVIFPDEDSPVGPAIVLSLSETSTSGVSALPDATLRTVRIADLPGSVGEAARSVVTAALDEPIRQSRPLLRIP